MLENILTFTLKQFFHLCNFIAIFTVLLLSDRNKILNDEQRRQRNNPQIKIDNAENSLFPKKMKCIMKNNYYKGLQTL